MTRFWPIFILIAAAATGAAFARPAPRDAGADRLIAVAQRNGFVLTRHETQGNALSIFTFSSPGCRAMKILPVSVLLQETALLKGIGAADDDRVFVYMQDRWALANSRPAAGALVWQQFVQMVRLRPRPAIDTMLYLVMPKNCRGQAGWSEFWDDI